MLLDLNRCHLLALVTWQFTVIFTGQQLFPIFTNFVPDDLCGRNSSLWHCASELKCAKDSPFHSMAMEFGCFCRNDYWSTLYIQVQFGGVLFGTLLIGMLSDHFGRKLVSSVVLATGILTAAATGFVHSLLALFLLRFVVGLCIGGCLVVVCTFIMEMLLPQQRMAMRAFCNCGVSRLVLTAVCYFTREWRSASVASALVALPGLFLILFVLPESPAWLHSKGRIDEMKMSERRIAILAGTEYVPVNRHAPVPNQPLSSLLRGGLLKKLLVLWMMWFTASASGYAVDLHSTKLSGNLFVNQSLFGVVIFCARVCMFICDHFLPWFSRRALHQLSQLGVVLCFGTLAALTLAGHEGHIFLVVNLLGMVFVEYTWDACYLVAAESMETGRRGTATGSCSLVARVGALIAPTLTYANEYWPPAVYVSVVALGATNLVQSYLFLEETKGVKLDDVTNMNMGDNLNIERAEVLIPCACWRM